MVSCDINAECNAGWTPLHVAVEMGHFQMVEHILKQPTLLINIKSKQGWTALHAAVDQDCVEIGRLLIQAKINVDAASEVKISLFWKSVRCDLGWNYTFASSGLF